jgi:hypothetical protein
VSVKHLNPIKMQEHQHKRTGKELDDKKKKKVKENQMTSEEATNKLNMFFEKNVATNPGKWSYYKSQAKKKFDVYHLRMQMVGLLNNIKLPVVVGKKNP